MRYHNKTFITGPIFLSAGHAENRSLFPQTTVSESANGMIKVQVRSTSMVMPVWFRSASVCVCLCFAGFLCVPLCAQSPAAQSNSPAASEPAPNAAAQQKMLEAMGQYASEYISNLPNFICEQITEQFQAGKKGNRWHKGDTLTSTLTFNQGKERRNLELVNNKPIRPGMKNWRTPLTTEGEFGVLLSRVFGAASNASFQWSGWQTINGQRVAVFDYAIDQQHSTLRLSRSDLANAVVPYHGSVYGDPDTGVIWRVTDGASGLPADLDTQAISTSIDYGEVVIGAAKYLVPVKASVSLDMKDKKVRNEMTFRNYRKFESQSTITFGDPTDEKTKPPQ